MKKSKRKLGKTINFAIVGCGRIAQRHAKHICDVGSLKAVCDIKRDRADTLARKCGATAYYSIDDLLKKEKSVDVVSICTPNGLHAEHSIIALQTGHHVLCEKPMAIKVRDCKRMISAAKKAKRRLFIVKQNRFNPPVAAVKKVIDEGRLGKIMNIQLNCFWNRNLQYYNESDWKGTKKLDGGTLFTQFSHFIDLIYWLIGDVHKVMVIRKNFIHKSIIDFEDTGIVLLKFNNGTIGTVNYTVNAYKKNMEGSLTIFGEKGTVKIGGQYLNELEYQEIENYKIKGLSKSNPPNKYGHYVGSMSNHDRVYKNIVEVLKNNGSVATDGRGGMKTIEIIEKIYNFSEIIK